MVQCFVCHSISVFRFDLIIVKDVLSHTYVFPNIECIFSAKSFSLGNPSLLSSLRQVLIVPDVLFKTTNAGAPKKHTGYPSGGLAASSAF